MQKGKPQNNNNKKHLSNSQNFITNRQLIRKIVNLSNIGKNDTILEIGTGIKLSHLSNLKLIHGDFLKYPLPAKGDYKIFANIPYFITTQIIEKLTNAPNPPSDIWLIMEKGAAKRFMGIPKENGKSLVLKVSWDMKILYHFRREDFHPMPSVDSVLLHFTRKATPDLKKADCCSFKKFVEHSMKYGICGRQGLLTKKQVAVALKQAGLPPAYEDRVTLYIQWLCLFRCYKYFHLK